MTQDHDPPVFTEPSAEEMRRRKAYERRVTAFFLIAGFLLLAGLYHWLSSFDAARPAAPAEIGEIPAAEEGWRNPFAAPRRSSESAPLPFVESAPQAQPDTAQGRAEGTVVAIVAQDGGRYARVEYYLPEANMNCFFHEGLDSAGNAGFYPGQKVAVTYDPSSGDACGTSRIAKD